MSISKIYQTMKFNELMESFVDIYESLDGECQELVEEYNALNEFNEKYVLPTMLTEELNYKEQDAADRMRSSGHSFYNEEFVKKHPNASKLFNEQRYTEGSGRIRIPVTLNMEKEPPNQKVVDFIGIHRYKTNPELYKNGLAERTVMVGDSSRGIPEQEKTVREKIGKILQNHDAPQHVKSSFMNDPSRQGSKTKDFDIILSHNHRDVYGMSTGRGWITCATTRSCDDPKYKGKGPATSHLPAEINNQTHVAYLVPRGGNVDTDAIGRVNFKRHDPIGGGVPTLIPESKGYGDMPTDAYRTIKHEVGKLFPVDEKKIYKKASGVYEDSGSPFHIPEHGVSTADLDATWQTMGGTKEDTEKRRYLFPLIQPGEKYKSTTLRKVAKHYQDASEYADAGNFPMAVDSIRSAYIESGARNVNFRSNPSLEKIHEKIGKTFNIDDPTHIETLKSLQRYRSDGDSSIIHHIRPNFDLKTIDGFVKRVKYEKEFGGGNYRAYDIPRGSEIKEHGFHQIAKYLHETNQLTEPMLSSVYHSLPQTKRKGGNYYDLLSSLKDHGIPNDHLIKSRANDMMSKNFGVDFLYHMKPQNRQEWADATGIDLERVKKTQFPEIARKYKELKQQIAQKKAQQAA